jgi:recombination protein RecR
MTEIDRLIQLLAKLPGLGPRSARRAALYLFKRRESILLPLAQAMAEAALRVKACSQCGNLDTVDPCAICTDGKRDGTLICVVEDVADLWAIERSGAFSGRYHVLGGTLSALEGVGPEELRVESLIARVVRHDVREAILALSATVEGQTTAHYLADRLGDSDVVVTSLGQGVPIGGELDYLDDGTLMAALAARRPVGGRTN